MKKYLLFTLALLAVAGTLAALEARAMDTPPAPKTVTAIALTEPIRIDGHLSESVWQNPGFDQFVQYNPKDGAIPTEKTTVWVAYDREALYIAARLYDTEPGKIVKRLGRRDDLVDSDWFKFVVDPYNDKRSGYIFAINPAGSILDGTLYNDQGENDSWDGVWEGKAAVDEQGWMVEMRIPFDQLHFKKTDHATWGVNFIRVIFRKSESLIYSWRPKDESGFVSHFGPLVGLASISSGHSLELLPYATGKVAFTPAEPENPFATDEKALGNLGVDLKLGLGSNLTFNATVNPDFGQVEVDPAVINLSAAETYYSEKRPFFIEGSSLFQFGILGGVSEVGANWGNPSFFYSRRIGHAPQGSVSSEGYVDMPETTTILGAAKLTGQIGAGWNIGVLSGLTGRESAAIDESGQRSRQEVEPLSDYTVLRMQKEFNQGRQGLGFIATGVWRDLHTPGLESELRNNAYSGGVNGWTMLGQDQTWGLSGYLGATRVSGSADAIWSLQQSYPHYFQRPAASYLHPDPNSTSMEGWAGRLVLNKQKGNFIFNTAIGAVSPGFDCTDLGFQYGSNIINGHVMVGYQSFTSGKLLRNWDVLLITQRNYDFGGDKIGEQRLIFITDATFLNNWSTNTQISVNPQIADNTLTRGGPQALTPAHTWGDFNINSDNRKAWVLSGNGGFDVSAMGPHNWYAGVTVNWKPQPNFSISVNPSYNNSYDPAQWLQKQTDPLQTSTYGNRYVFGELRQRTLAMPIRLNWIFTPRLSLQAYLQPFIAVGAYRGFKEFARPRTYDFNVYGSGSSSISYAAGEYTVNPGAGGSPFTLADPDFNYKSLRGTVVLRWEYRLGSTLYLVWTQTRADFENPGDLALGRDLGAMLRAPGDNIIMLKATYRFKI